jgi:hypothetical protein
MDETYIKVKGKWVYLYRAVDSHGDTLDFIRGVPTFAKAHFGHPSPSPLKLIMILFYAHWEIRVNYLKNHLDLRQNPKKPIHDGSQKNELNGYVQLLFPSPP